MKQTRKARIAFEEEVDSRPLSGGGLLLSRDTAFVTGVAAENVRARVHQGRTMRWPALANHVAYDGLFDTAAGGVRRSKMG